MAAVAAVGSGDVADVKFRSFIDYAGQADQARAVMVTPANTWRPSRTPKPTNAGSFLFPYRNAAARVDSYAAQLDSLAINDSHADAVESLRKFLSDRMRIIKNVLLMKTQRPYYCLSTVYTRVNALWKSCNDTWTG